MEPSDGSAAFSHLAQSNDKPSKPELAEKTDMLKNYFELPVFFPSDF